MLDQIIPWLLAAASVAAGLVAGVFLTFSDFVMRSLGAAAPAAGMEAMQQINRKVYRSIFMVLLLGLAPVSLAIAAHAAIFAGGAAGAWLIAGAAFYLLGVFGVTGAGNVPMNKRLDVIDPVENAALGYWARYERNWTLLNHVRTVASAGSAICFLVGAMLTGQAG
ncbi:MAG: hypothetical protein CL534_27475 [Ahrensia sp.]|nr:hypothetical protein [Ahrensia sp.]